MRLQRSGAPACGLRPSAGKAGLLLWVSAVSLAVAGTGCFDSISETPIQGDPGGGGCPTCHHSATQTGTRGGSSSGTSTSTVSASSGTTTSSVTSSSSVASSSSTATSSSSMGSSSGGSFTTTFGGGSSGLLTCQDMTSGNPTLFDCSSDVYYVGTAAPCTTPWLGSQVVDFNTCLPLCGATASAVAPSGVVVAGTSQVVDSTYGTFHYCLPPGATFEPTVNAPGYATFVYGEIEGQLGINLPQFGMLQTSTLDAYGNFIPGGINMADGAIVLFIFDVDDCGGANAAAGWTISLTDGSGNAYPAGGYSTLYINSSGFPDPTLGSTSAYGVELIYNIDPTVAQFPILKEAPPAGSACQVINPFIGFTGHIQVGAGIFSEQGIFIE